MITRTTVRLPKPLLDAAKKLAAEEGQTVTSLLVEGLQQRLSQSRKQKRRIRMPRVCSESIKSAKAGRSFTIEDVKAAEEQADIQYARRWMGK